MDPYPLRLPEGLRDDLQEEADERDLNLAEYIRGILRRRPAGEDTQQDTQRDTLENTIGELAEQIEDLEARVADLESGGEPPGGERITQPNTLENTQRDTQEDTQRDTALAELVDELDIPGRGRTTREKRREVARDYLRWVREQGSVKREDVMHEFVDEEILERAAYSDAKGYWEHYGRDMLQQAAELGAVEIRASTYHWSDEFEPTEA